MQGNQLTSSPSPKRVRNRISWALSLALSLTGLLLTPPAATAEPEELEWARVDFLSNRVQLVPREQRSRRARIADVLSIGDALRTARASRAELRFNDGSLARVGERATFRFTPNTRNFQLSNGTVLLLIPPGRGRSTIQTPNAVTGIQGSALFVRYIPETDTTIVGALTDNPSGPMILFNEAGTERQALRSNEIGVIEGDRITQIYQFDGALFWQSSGLAEGFDYLAPPSQTGDPLDGVREEIREALSNQRPLNSDSVIENPDSFSRPAPPVEEVPEPAINEPVAANSPDSTTTTVIADSPETSTAGGGLSDTETMVEAAAETTIDGVPTTEALSNSEELDLDVALDLELELEIEADGVEAPDLDINETVQQYLEGGAADLNDSSDFEADNSLQSVDLDEEEALESNPPAEAASSSDTANEDEPIGVETTNEAPDIEEDQTVINSELDGSEPDTTSSNDLESSNTTPSSDTTAGNALPLDQTSGQTADQNIADDATGADLLTDDPAKSDLSSTASTGSAAVVTSPVLESQVGSSSGLPPRAVKPAATATTLDPDLIPAAVPSDISPDLSPSATSSNLAEGAVPVVQSGVNVIDLSPGADEPPVEVFLPADKIDDLMMQEMGSE